MRISKKTQDQLYGVIFAEILDTRVRLKLPPKQDVILAEIIHRIWARQKAALGLWNNNIGKPSKTRRALGRLSRRQVLQQLTVSPGT